MTLPEDIKRIEELLKDPWVAPIKGSMFTPRFFMLGLKSEEMREYVSLCANTAPALIERLQKAEELLREWIAYPHYSQMEDKTKQFLGEA